ncbi:MAG: pyruvate, phosphate dikinase, partial [Clostridiales bacterium]|nr:pyruvate, phosphate dikinase [Clostridiales bacterium]
EDFCQLLDRIICSPNSTGKIGGKATGFFIANQILKEHIDSQPAFKNLKIPKTWYISSDELDNLLYENGLDELHEHKYHDILEIRNYYPKIIQTLKSASFSSYVLSQLNQILDETENKPLIIRSSSILEDQIDSAFSGKYKSLFITNSGPKDVRLKSLVEGILEVYASMYNPDSIQYRKERNLLDCKEQMAIMVQEVVGCRVGPYYFPLYAGVAFSNNELRWSPRIKREDGLIRMVMGLGTRAVDRVGDDFPVLISPGQPKLTVNHAPGELRRYSPRMLDAIDLDNNRFRTISIAELIKEYGNQIPKLNHIVSVMKNDFLTEYNRFTADHRKDEFIVTFEGLINKTDIISEIKAIMSLLKDKLGYPVDIEFAYDGNNFYLLQCRSQSVCHDSRPAAIPANIALQNTIFTANKYISNGKVTGIKTVVYVDPMEYSELESHQEMVNVANAISELNRILPRRSFILMGPGRWGSRGDIKLGVQVTYSDINNTAMLIEIAHSQSKHQPELSFGTHFFQDLVEANIKYLPLYPEDNGIIFNKSFFNNCRNELEEILPAYADLSKVIKVINIEKNFYGKELNVLMNADLEKAIAFIDTASRAGDDPYTEEIENETGTADDQGWRWRHYMAERIAREMDFEAYGVKGVYLFGSTNTCTARLNSDIDLLIHIEGGPEQRKRLDLWLNGWSKALAEMNYLKTGYKTNGLLDVHYITDKDIEEKNSYAVKINSVYDPASPLRVK